MLSSAHEKYGKFSWERDECTHAVVKVDVLVPESLEPETNNCVCDLPDEDFTDAVVHGLCVDEH